MSAASTGAVLVLGGARSGKSRFAEDLVLRHGGTPHYVATGRAFDDEMRARILKHRDDRGPGWITTEEPVDLVSALRVLDDPAHVVLVDCLTLWVTNLMMEDRDLAVESAALADFAAGARARIVFVSNEVGLGIVPENRMARQFRDHAGRLHQQLAAVAGEVYFIAAGLPLKMKG